MTKRRLKPATILLFMLSTLIGSTQLVSANPAPESAQQTIETTRLNATTITGDSPLQIHGQVKVLWTEGVKVTLTSPSGTKQSVMLSATGHYTFGSKQHPITTGLWQIRVTDTVTGATMLETVAVKNASVEMKAIELYKSEDDEPPQSAHQQNNPSEKSKL